MSPESLHTVFIAVHAASASISFLAGCFLIFSVSLASNRRLFDLYWWTLVGMVAFLTGAMIVAWPAYALAERIIFPGLWVLAMYMLYRARSAGHLLSDHPAAWKHDYVEHIGFTLISLFEGFIIVGGLNAGFPGWLVGVLAIAGFFIGRSLIGLAQRRGSVVPSSGG